MILFAHLGLGARLARPFRGHMPWAPLLVGTLAPDLIDKTLYYGAMLVTGQHGAALGILSGTRTFGHTALLWIALATLALITKSPRLGALCLGASTHLFLDNVGDRIQGFAESSAWIALTFPLNGWRFSVIPFSSPTEHAWALLRPFHLVTESLGLLLFLRDFAPRSFHKFGIKLRPRSSKHDPKD